MSENLFYHTKGTWQLFYNGKNTRQEKQRYGFFRKKSVVQVKVLANINQTILDKNKKEKSSTTLKKLKYGIKDIKGRYIICMEIIRIPPPYALNRVVPRKLCDGLFPHLKQLKARFIDLLNQGKRWLSS